MQEAVRHHYVPRFYLEQWAGPDGKLCITRRIGERLLESRLAPKSTAFQERLYSFKDEPLSTNPRPDIIETKVLASVDDHGARAHRRLLEVGPAGLTTAERRAWATFLNAMFERDLRHIRQNEATAKQIAEQVIKEMEDSAPDEASRERVSMATCLIDTSAAASNLVLRTMVKDMQAQDVLEYFENMWWIVFDMPPELALHTSDRPLVVNVGQQRTPINIAWMSLSPAKLFAMFPKSWIPQDASRLSGDIEETFRMMAGFHNLLLLQERPERLYSQQPISESERRAARALLTTAGE